jgi:hypothetical protein
MQAPNNLRQPGNTCSQSSQHLTSSVRCQRCDLMCLLRFSSVPDELVSMCLLKPCSSIRCRRACQLAHPFSCLQAGHTHHSGRREISASGWGVARGDGGCGSRAWRARAGGRQGEDRSTIGQQQVLVLSVCGRVHHAWPELHEMAPLLLLLATFRVHAKALLKGRHHC